MLETAASLFFLFVLFAPLAVIAVTLARNSDAILRALAGEVRTGEAPARRTADVRTLRPRPAPALRPAPGLRAAA